MTKDLMLEFNREYKRKKIKLKKKKELLEKLNS